MLIENLISPKISGFKGTFPGMTRKRPQTISLQLPTELFDRINTIAKSMNLSRNNFLKQMIEMCVTDLENEEKAAGR